MLVLMALMSAGVNAHVTSYDEHEAMHLATTLDAISTVEVSHAYDCNQSHCGHGHTTGLLTEQVSFIKTATTASIPTHLAGWVSSLIASNIERPKWPFTTSAVVNLLG